MHALRSLAIVIACVGAISCGTVEELGGLWEKQQALQEELSKFLGSEAQVGFNWHNGRLLDVTTRLDAAALGDKTIEDLGAEIVPVITRHFGEAPEEVGILLVWHRQGRERARAVPGVPLSPASARPSVPASASR